MDRRKLKIKATSVLIILCWIVYTCSYIGKLNYAANINQVMSYYSISHADAGLVSTLFFFSYGIGQVLNGIWCKKYNLRWIVFASLAVSAATNLLIAVSPSFELIKYLWVINGFSLSMLWPSLIRLLSETLPTEDMARASVIMGTTTATGTFFIYGLSAVFAAFTSFKAVFYIAAGTLLATAAVWLIYVNRLSRAAASTARETSGGEALRDEAVLESKKPHETQHASRCGLLMLTICMLAIFGIATNFVKDGLTTWVPSILKENYGLDDSLSIVLTLALPIVSIFGNVFAVSLHKKIPDFVYQCATVFLVSGAVIGLLIVSFEGKQFILPLIAFALICFLVGSCNSLITSIFPLFMKGKVDSGLIAGVLNGFCYVGSTLSSYGLGLIADNFGWAGVFRLLLGVCVLAVLGTAVYAVIKAAMKKSK